MALFKASFLSDSFQRNVSVNVLLPSDTPLPPGQTRDWGPYKTLYLLHGLRGDCDSWLTNSNIQRYSMLFNIAVVMPDGCNAFYVDQPHSTVQGSRYIGEELIEFTRKTFPLSDKREDTILGGLSMGGYGTLYNSLKHGDVFGHAIALSTPVKVIRYESECEPKETGFRLTPGFFETLHGDLASIDETDRNIAKQAKKVLETGKPVTNLYMACGYNDSLVPENRELHEKLTDMGFPHKYEEGPGTHDWPFFSDYLYHGLAYVLGKPQIPPHPFWVEKTDYNV